MQVMLLWNIKLTGEKSKMLVNGSRGVIVGWKSTEQILGERWVKGREDRCEWDGSIFDLLRKSGIECVPVVQFRNGSVVDCVPVAFTHEVLNVGVCTRLQVKYFQLVHHSIPTFHFAEGLYYASATHFT